MEYKYEEVTKRIIGSAMKVHSALGNGFQACLPKGSTARRQEVIYQRAMEIEMPYQNLTFEREKEMGIYYREKDIGTRRVDFFVEKLIMVELKAIVKLEDVHLAQALNYLEAYNMEVGMLINFGTTSLE